MFHVTERLLLRPSWPEDAPAILSAIGDEAIVRNLARAPWPYGPEDALAFASMKQDARIPHFLLELPGEGVIGSAGFGEQAGEIEIGYWIARKWWGQGFATEASRALVDLGRFLGHERLVAGHFVDNPASGKVLRKVGFQPTGAVAKRFSRARGAETDCAEYALDLAEQSPRIELKCAA
ncbi:GNAT family N-acetyltransferase [Qipengyuania spongiae]|uniref:GNAT family N-acetyltransferase n=1 Tax=Qipengyuania spongiae TaxID=2909673 RepID=A0ABY5SVF7_9SPHN|nr:GNAT family N-acetyltransferase [Qipengyuania spongiae]UVI38482.1 GNAT family N-acetyltransferase [Qipengyuania spongiae]